MSNNDPFSTQQAADEPEEESSELSSLDDDDYEDSHELRFGGSIAETTPSQRARDPPVPRPRERVAEVDPNKGRCLIENCSTANGIEYAHCVPRYLTKNSELVSL